VTGETRSPYDVLGVSHDADPVVIEAAFKVLMRRFHPDRPTGDAAKAAEINAAYSILRDTDRRQRFEAEQAAMRRDAARMADPRSKLHHQPVRKRTGQKIALSAIAALAALGVTALLTQDFQQLPTPPPNMKERLETSQLPQQQPVPSGGGPFQPEDQSVRPLLVQRAIERYNKIADQEGAQGVQAFSAYCFDAQARTNNFNDFVFCAAFDNAAAIAGAARSGRTNNNYFGESQALDRQLAVAGRYSEDTVWIRQTLENIWELSVSASIGKEHLQQQSDRADSSEEYDLADPAPENTRSIIVSSPRVISSPQFRSESPLFAQRAAMVAAEDWASCVAKKYQIRLAQRQFIGVDSAFSSCSGQERATRRSVQAALEAKGGNISLSEVDRNMEAIRSTIRSALQ